MSFPTKPAFIYDFPKGDFDENTRAHPALKWLETYLREVIEGDKWHHHPHDLGHHPDSFIKSGSGHIVRGAEDHHKASKGMFEDFAEFYHVYDDIVVWETNDGWMSMGTAHFYYNTEDGKSGSVKSHDGRSWEGVTPGAYKIHYTKSDGGEIQLAGVEIFNESTRHEGS